MANLTYGEVLEKYRREGYLIVPGFYNKDGKDYHCKICRWANDHAGERECKGCGYTKMKAGREKKEIRGVDVCKLTLEEWQVFQIIVEQIKRGETPCITIEDFARGCEKRIEEANKKYEAEKAGQQLTEVILYG